MASFLLSMLAAMFLPTGCNTPGWSFCVDLPPEARMEVVQDVEDFIVYQFDMSDGSGTFIYVGWAPQIQQSGQWSERRQGLETVRWQASGDGRIDYYIERVWAESAGIPRWVHAWVVASETGEISDAEALILTLRSCDPGLCPAPGPALPTPPLLPPQAPYSEMQADSPPVPSRPEGPAMLIDDD
jgi:hypothetical protein